MLGLVICPLIEDPPQPETHPDPHPQIHTLIPRYRLTRPQTSAHTHCHTHRPSQTWTTTPTLHGPQTRTPGSPWAHTYVCLSQSCHMVLLQVCACSLMLPSHTRGKHVHTAHSLPSCSGPPASPPPALAGQQGPPHLVIEALQEAGLLHQCLHIGLQVGFPQVGAVHVLAVEGRGGHVCVCVGGRPLRSAW